MKTKRTAGPVPAAFRAPIIAAAAWVVLMLVAGPISADEGVFFIDLASAEENLAMLLEEAADLRQRIGILRAENASIRADIQELQAKAGNMQSLYDRLAEKRGALEEISIHIQDLALKGEVDEALRQNRETEGSLLVNLNGQRLIIKDLETKLGENLSILEVLEKRLDTNEKSVIGLREAIEKSQSQAEVLKGFLQDLDTLNQEITPYLEVEGTNEAQTGVPEAAEPAPAEAP